ncbi:hypothetical protein PIB30_016962 [Stylosanthes scabra]|uniref:Uncharacterized protein n=1 Tax=Stylosanthes scabra TaxID=79078 RepID=A0ABU6Y757_9FABA|nr:hypothetical protein [Stylosanthes scabra]
MISPNKKNEKKEKNKRKIWKQGQWRGRPLLMVRPHDLKLPKSITIGATVAPYHLNGTLACLVRPLDGLGAPAR